VSQLAGGPAIRIAMEMVMGIWMLMEMQMAVSKHYNQQLTNGQSAVRTTGKMSGSIISHYSLLKLGKQMNLKKLVLFVSYFCLKLNKLYKIEIKMYSQEILPQL